MSALRTALRSEDKTVHGVALVAGVIAFTIVIFSGAYRGPFQPAGDTVRATFASTGQLKVGDSVRVNGINAGRVDAIDLDEGGRSASVRMIIEKAGRPLYADASAMIRWRTALGGSFAIDLKRGTPSSGPLATGAIPIGRTRNQVELDEILTATDAEARAGLRTMLAELPPAFRHPGVPRAAFSALADVSPSLSTALSAIRGQGEQDLRPLIASTARTVRALDAPTGGVRVVVEGAAATTRVTAARRAELARTITLAATTQPRIRATLTQLRGTLDAADPLIAKLRRAAPEVAPAIRELRPTVVGADRLLGSARPLLRDLRPAAHSLADTARAGAPLLADLKPSLERVVDRILPDLAERDPVTKMRTYEIIGPTIASLNGSAATFDGEGHLFRFPALGGERAIGDMVPCNVLFTDPEATAFLQCKTLQSALKSYLTYRPAFPSSKAKR